MKTKKNDFIELDFTANVKDGNIFDTTKREEALKAGLITETDKREFKPLNICIGKGMVIKGLDKELEDKEEGKDYEVELQPKEAFGQRKPNLVRPAPLSAFKERPIPGMLVNVDGIIAKVINIAGGRALLDFNSLLAGKIVVYKFKINKIIKETDQKIKILAKPLGLELSDITVEGRKIKAKIKGSMSNKALKELKKRIKEILSLEFET